MTNKTDAWMPLWIGSYLADTQRLTRDQHGGYLLLIMDYWRNGPPPDDDEVLRAITKATPAEWKKLRPTLAGFFKIRDGKWNHKRIDHELEQSMNRKKKAQSKAAAGGSTRWRSEDASAAERGRHMRSQRLAEARKKGTHTDDQWARMKEIHGFRCVRCNADGELVKDHIKPIYQGGSDGIENIQPLCRSCNASKGPEDADLRIPDWRNAFAEGIQEGIKKASEGIQEGRKRLPDACPTPSPIEDSVPNGTGGQPPPGPGEVDPTKAIFDLGVSVLTAAGQKPESARSLVGKLRKVVGDDRAMAVLVAAKSATSPAEYIGAAIKPDPIAEAIQRRTGERAFKQPDGTYRSAGRTFNADGSGRVALC